MKILHVINSLGVGGAERLVADLAPLQRDCGNDVEVLLLRGGDSRFREILEDAGIRVFDFGKTNNIYSPLNIFRMLPFVRKYDVIHAHLFPAQYWTAIATKISFSFARLVTTEHNTTNRRREIRVFRFADRRIYSCYNAIIGISQKTTDSLFAYLNGARRIATIENGINLERFIDAMPGKCKKIVPEDAEFLLMQIAGFREQKDQDCVLRALKILPQGVHAVFVGDGERRKDCEKLAEELGVRERAHFLGVRADVPALLKAADIVVMSSHWEGFGLAAVEGMAAGKPVVASDVPGLAEVVGGAGILFPQGDESALAGTIMRLATDKDFYAHTAAACSRRAQNFDIRKTAAEYLKIYDEVCADFAERKEIKP